MSIEVYTEAKCDRCGFSDRKEGSEAYSLPYDWTDCSMGLKSGYSAPSVPGL